MTPQSVVEELFRRIGEGRTDIDDLMAEDLVNHAAGPQGRDGWKQITAMIDHDLGPDLVFEHHHLIADADLVAHHMTLHGTHRASTMPLLTGTAPTHAAVAWRFVHIWRVDAGRIVEHWACRDDMDLLRQLRPP